MFAKVIPIYYTPFKIGVLDPEFILNFLQILFQGTGEFINTKFFCRVCSMLHDPKVQTEPFSYPDVNEWWRGKGVCINGSWRKFQKALDSEKSNKPKPQSKINNKISADKSAADSSNDHPSKSPENLKVLEPSVKSVSDEERPPAKLP